MIKGLLKSLIVFVFGSLIVEGTLRGLDNKAHGKTLFGKSKAPRSTYEDLTGNVHLSPEDGTVA